MATYKRKSQGASKAPGKISLDMERESLLGKKQKASSGAAAMNFDVNSLTTDAKLILYLIYACKGEPVPEEVLRLLYGTSKTSTTFFTSMEELSSTELLEASTGPTFITSMEELSSMELPEASTGTLSPKSEDTNEGTSEPAQHPKELKAWSLLSVARCHMDVSMAGKDDIKSVLNALPDDGEISLGTEPVEIEKARVAIALCALYFDGSHTDEIVRDVSTRSRTACSLMDSNNSVNGQRRRAIEPLIWLMDQPIVDDDQWTELNIRRSRQVFLRYVCERKLDGANMAALLKLASYPSASLATLAAIRRIFSMEETPLLNNGHLKFLKVLVNLLKPDQDVHPAVQKAASKALLSISYISLKAKNDLESTAVVVNTPGILAVLVSTIRISFLDYSTSLSRGIADNAAHTLYNLSCSGGESMEFQVLNDKEVIEVLGNALAKRGNPNLQKNAAGTLRNLACGGESIKLQILKEDGALAGLVTALLDEENSEENPVLQEFAAGALGNLAFGDDPILVFRILDEDGALKGLVTSLFKEANPPLQINAAAALGNLAYGGNFVKRQILDEKLALAGLVRCFSKDNNPNLQETAAGALRNLSSGDDSIKLQILNSKGVLTSLVRFLSNDDNPLLQKYAGATLENLSLGGDSIKQKILNENGTLQGLVKLMLKDLENRHGLQECAARAFRELATGEESVKLQILNEGDALAGLVSALSKDEDPNLQKHAAATLGNLAFGGESIKLQIIKTDGALPGLVSSLSKVNNLQLQENAAEVLWILASGGESITIQIANTDGVLTGLVRSLYNDYNPNLQANAAAALGNLAGGRDSIKCQILDEDQALAGLVLSLSKHKLPDLQEKAIWALSNLAQGDDSVKLQILNGRDALAGLVSCLCQQGNPDLRTWAAGALKFLSTVQDLSMKQKMRNQDWLLRGLLLMSVSEQSNPALRKDAIEALKNLAI